MQGRILQAGWFAVALLTAGGAACQAGAQTAAKITAPAVNVHQHMSPEQQAKLMDEYCSDCHNDDLKSGSMTLTALDPKHPEKNVALAEQVIRKVGVGMMPPPGKRRPDADTLKMFSASLAADVDTYAATHPSFNNPPLHRLNRTEYANSIRSLLSVDINPEMLLPSDQMSHGFDNMADALTLSPALMEAYVRAGGKISREAIGDKNAPPTAATYSIPRVVSQMQHVDGTPFGTRGGIAVTHNFPADGTYTFKVSFYFSLDGPLFGGNAAMNKGQQVEISVDGARVALIELTPQTKKYDDIHTPPIALKAGPHKVAAAFLQTADGPVEDSVMPIGLSLLDLNEAVMPGLTVLPHVHELNIIGPTQVTGISETPSRKRIFSCYPKAAGEEEACAHRILASLAEQAYRRPVGSDEVKKLMSFYTLGHQEDGFEGGVRTALQAIISSPSFIFRFEQDRSPARAVSAQAGAYRIEDTELATRLSFFLWSAPPDEQLMALARQKQLHQPAVMERQVKRMLADPRSNAMASNFAGQWLHLQNLKSVQPDGYLFPLYDKTLGNSMRTETEMLFESIIRDDASVLTLLNAKYTYVNERLSQLYGIPNVYGNRFRRVAITDPNRFGLLGQASILTLTSASNRTSPVGRGKYVMEVLLGTPPPPPPPVPPLKENAEGAAPLSVRERLEEHRKNPTCAGCHKFMDPIGFALENYDPIGQWRTFDSTHPIDSAGNMYDGTKLDGPASLRVALLAHSDAFIGTFTENLYAYGLGRVLHPSDMTAVRIVDAKAAAHGNRFSDFVLGIVNSDAFRMRRTETDVPSHMLAVMQGQQPQQTAVHHE